MPAGTPHPVWKTGRAKPLMPPPEPLHAVSLPYPAQAGLAGVSPLLHVGVVPPTPITCGELAGLSTESVLWQSRLPLSPEAANQDCPMAFALAKMALSVASVPASISASQAPQLVVTMCPGLSVTIRLYAAVKSTRAGDFAM